MLTIHGVEEARALAGRELPVSQWHPVRQPDVDTFAELTGDRQFIHVDPERARQTPFGGTVAHGFYTLSLIPRFSYEIVEFTGFSFAVNYGLGRVRFPAPLPVGSRVRMRALVDAVEEVPGGLQIVRTDTLESDRGGKPVCVAETLARLYL
jgi:acyl dehydratase